MVPYFDVDFLLGSATGKYFVSRCYQTPWPLRFGTNVDVCVGDSIGGLQTELTVSTALVGDFPVGVLSY